MAVKDPVLAAQRLEVLAESLADERVGYLAVRRIQVQALAEILTVLLQEPAAGVQKHVLAVIDRGIHGGSDDGAISVVVLGMECSSIINRPSSFINFKSTNHQL